MPDNTCFDVAQEILFQKSPVSAVKFQKLIYYAQAWHLAWHSKPLFNEEIEAWNMGPVVPQLYAAHKGLFILTQSSFKEGDRLNLSHFESESIRKVLKFYGFRNSQWLRDLITLEEPWNRARENFVRSIDKEIIEGRSKAISHRVMMQYYRGLSIKNRPPRYVR